MLITLHQIKDLLIDFLFPRNKKVLELEAFTVNTLLNSLPEAEALKDKDIIAIFDYRHSMVKEMIWQLKYNGNIRIADKLGKILYDIIFQKLLDNTLFSKGTRPIIIPIPISKKRQFERGWNQSELLIEHFIKHDSKNTFKYLPDQLIKIRHTESQTKTSSKEERLRNLTDSMKVLDSYKFTGECVIIIDDVITTGSTFTEAKRALKTAGVKKILCVAIAH